MRHRLPCLFGTLLAACSSPSWGVRVENASGDDVAFVQCGITGADGFGGGGSCANLQNGCVVCFSAGAVARDSTVDLTVRWSGNTAPMSLRIPDLSHQSGDLRVRLTPEHKIASASCPTR
jgi:hypothetical protein